MQVIPLDLVELCVDSEGCRAQSQCAESSSTITEIVRKLRHQSFLQ